VFIWEFLASGGAKKSGVLTRAVINVARVKEIRHAYKVGKRARSETRYNCLRMGTTQGPLW
jgi:hypothetical protein